jgi:hypothetical protein
VHLLAAAVALALPAPVTFNGVAGVVPGMTVSQASQRWGIRLILSPNGQGCTITPVRAKTMGGYALFTLGHFGAAFFNSGTTTDRGIHIGSTLEKVRHAYPALTSRKSGRQQYARRGGRYIRFDVSRGRVTQIAFGDRQVFDSENCVR